MCSLAFILSDFGTAQFVQKQELHQLMKDAVKTWGPDLRGLVERVDVSTIAPHAIRRVKPTAPWQTTRVTVLGDAIHAMPPSFGAGANTALRDAATLAEKLIAVHRSEQKLVDAIAQYEDTMRGYAYPILEMSSDHEVANRYQPTT
ncbi:FAD-dependent oxidoreductase [Brevibacillus dissolubilis]|uniref:FAD-dependent oxidoreductase n=1 Tax=Brevibacillus dissolubilis TaxID=1844116 RepID=UPI0021002E79|nr:FAD-dependent monooxygenase [Brevibacillus dissolubilis]